MNPHDDRYKSRRPSGKIQVQRVEIVRVVARAERYGILLMTFTGHAVDDRQRQGGEQVQHRGIIAAFLGFSSALRRPLVEWAPSDNADNDFPTRK